MRVILNIIDNSRKYMDKEQGEITILLRETNSSIIIEIRDNGSGIDENDVNKILTGFTEQILQEVKQMEVDLDLPLQNKL